MDYEKLKNDIIELGEKIAIKKGTINNTNYQKSKKDLQNFDVSNLTTADKGLLKAIYRKLKKQAKRLGIDYEK